MLLTQLRYKKKYYVFKAICVNLVLKSVCSGLLCFWFDRFGVMQKNKKKNMKNQTMRIIQKSSIVIVSPSHILRRHTKTVYIQLKYFRCTIKCELNPKNFWHDNNKSVNDIEKIYSIRLQLKTSLFDVYQKHLSLSSAEFLWIIS